MSSGVVFRDVIKGYTLEQDKLCPPEETLAWVRERLARVNQRILLKTMRIDSGRLDIPVYISLCGPDAVAVTGTQKQMGKGLSAAQSETSALMELVERFSFFNYVKKPPFLRAPYQAVADQALPAELLFESIHDETSERNEALELIKPLPLNWVWARNLTADRDELIPLDWFYLINEYNGPAAGNCLEEAASQALAEVVERHSASVVDHERRPTPTIDPASIPEGPARIALSRFQDEGIELYLKDFSLDTGIPTVAALAWDPATLGVSEIVFQAGTTTDPQKSVIRTLTEVQQMACDFRLPTTYRATLPKFSTLKEAEFLMDSTETVPLAALPCLTDDNLKVEIEAQVAALARINLPVYVVNVTHPQLGVPAVYVIVPGAHFRARTREGSVLFHAAKLAAEHADEKESVTALEAMASAHPGHFALQFFSGLCLERSGRPEEALVFFQRALDQGPGRIDQPAVLTHIGVCHKDMGRFQEALGVLEKARDLDQSQWEIHHLMGVCFFNLKNHEAAMESFGQAIEADPGSGIDYANIGSCLREMGRREEAVKMYRSALELDPSLDFARQNIERLAAS